MSVKDSVLEIKNANKTYYLKKGQKIEALIKVNLNLIKGKTLGIVGESGSGKTTLAKAILGVEKLDSGEILFEGRKQSELTASEKAQMVQMVFQDPHSSLNPKKRIFDTIAEPLIINGIMDHQKVLDTSLKVGLSVEMLSKFPHMLSGGQKQRVAIARALILCPRLIVCDEPVSALDVSVQAQVLNLLKDLKQQEHQTMIFISHDLNVVRYIADEILVIYKGEIVEQNSNQAIFSNPQHSYTKMLLNSIPGLDPVF